MTARTTAGCWGLAALVVLACLGTGCVRRTLTLNSDPQGARVFLNDDEIGTSPVSVDFTWYGTYDVILRKDGYESLKTSHRIEPPWYQWLVVDFVTEVLLPIDFHDKQEATFTLEPARPIDHQTLREEAAQFRERALFTPE